MKQREAWAVSFVSVKYIFNIKKQTTKPKKKKKKKKNPALNWESGNLTSGNDSVNIYDNFKRLFYLIKYLISVITR